jgi:hypothetical protein
MICLLFLCPDFDLHSGDEAAINFSPTWFSWTFVMAYSKAKLKSSIEHLLVLDHFGQKNYQTDVYQYGLYYVLFKHILLNLTSFMGTPNSIRLLYNTSSSLNHRLYIPPLRFKKFGIEENEEHLPNINNDNYMY